MGKIGGLFSLKGRTSRLNYWRIQLLFALVFAVVWCAGLFVAISTQIGGLSAVGLAGAAAVVGASWATVVRRLHDRNKSGWWLIVFYVLPLSADMALNAMKGLAEQYPLPVMAAALVSMALSAWAFVEIGILRGTPGANRYGDDPLAPELRPALAAALT